MVIFGAPHDMNEEAQAKHACQCAIAMQQGMATVNEKWTRRGLDEVSMRIGIHHGPLVVGTFGCEERSDYTAIGPTVNIASRIESVCGPGMRISISTPRPAASQSMSTVIGSGTK